MERVQESKSKKERKRVGMGVEIDKEGKEEKRSIKTEREKMGEESGREREKVR